MGGCCASPRKERARARTRAEEVPKEVDGEIVRPVDSNALSTAPTPRTAIPALNLPPPRPDALLAHDESKLYPHTSISGRPADAVPVVGARYLQTTLCDNGSRPPGVQSQPPKQRETIRKKAANRDVHKEGGTKTGPLYEPPLSPPPFRQTPTLRRDNAAVVVDYDNEDHSTSCTDADLYQEAGCVALDTTTENVGGAGTDTRRQQQQQHVIYATYLQTNPNGPHASGSPPPSIPALSQTSAAPPLSPEIYEHTPHGSNDDAPPPLLSQGTAEKDAIDRAAAAKEKKNPPTHSASGDATLAATAAATDSASLMGYMNGGYVAQVLSEAANEALTEAAGATAAPPPTADVAVAVPALPPTTPKKSSSTRKRQESATSEVDNSDLYSRLNPAADGGHAAAKAPPDARAAVDVATAAGTGLAPSIRYDTARGMQGGADGGAGGEGDEGAPSAAAAPPATVTAAPTRAEHGSTEGYINQFMVDQLMAAEAASVAANDARSGRNSSVRGTVDTGSTVHSSGNEKRAYVNDVMISTAAATSTAAADDDR